MMISTRQFILSLLTLTVFAGAGCSTTEQGVERGESPVADSAFTGYEDLTSLQYLLDISRSKLSDLHASQKHDMPEAFLKKESGDESINTDPFDGYRIQIISTKDMPMADSVANDFRMWADTTIKGYSAEAYTFFKQPFFKVHVGDFQQRSQANNFSQLVKEKYPAAWVVHDRIDPSNAPADTASFSFVTEADSLNKAASDSL